MNQEQKKLIGQRIKSMRTALGLYQSHLAEKVGVDRASISNYEIGRAVPPWDVAVKMAEVFNCTTDYLLGNTNINLYDWVPSPQEASEQEQNKVHITKETPASYAHEKEFLSKIELSDEELVKQFKLSVDGRELSEKELRKLVAFLRMERSLD
ncbi:helix-turn-helix domain-containing protein [Brevibacillus sp. HD3.3A]|uniref:helix-turn-helix domain-containing protein n=1 Tax=Brevibacillus sp. HD3.3A TaxID=2738979 RepID=UPI00156AEC92|nr:helix-turn-helix transcriptional regulator [Brevibacillus sp. HD3.3A]UED70727.1 helix-turn-helix domain-containing protein [Brevibacillus sp. HD3.3A]